MAQREGRAQGLAVSLAVGLAFAAAAVVLFGLVWLLAGQGPAAATGVGAVFALAWVMATVAAIVPLALRLGRLRAGVARTAAGPAPDGSVGARAGAEGGAVVTLQSRAPSIFAALSAALLLAAELLMFGGRTTSGAGALAGALAAFVLLGAARGMWPRP